jgi:hypothetical protein
VELGAEVAYHYVAGRDGAIDELLSGRARGLKGGMAGAHCAAL